MFYVSSPFFIEDTVMLFYYSVVIEGILVSLYQLLLFSVVCRLFVSAIVVGVGRIFHGPTSFVRNRFSRWGPISVWPRDLWFGKWFQVFELSVRHKVEGQRRSIQCSANKTGVRGVLLVDLM